jgi:hypothetical protein
VVSDLSAVNNERKKVGDRPCDGLLGTSFLQLHSGVIDYPSGMLFLMHPVNAGAAIYKYPAGQGVDTTVNWSIKQGKVVREVILRFTSDKVQTLTKPKYDQLKPGMTYAKVTEVMGSELAKGRMTPDYTGRFTMLQDNRRIDLTFQDGKVTERTQNGLE